MATWYVKKDGTGTHTTIQGAIFSAQEGDTVLIEAGTFSENIDLYKGITLEGADKSLTIIEGSIKTSVVKQGTWAIGSNTLNIPSGTAGYDVGRVVTASGIPSNTRIVQVNPTSLVISANTTAAKTTLTNVTMGQVIEGTLRVRGSGAVIKKLKIKGYDGATAGLELAALYFKVAGLGAAAATNFLIDDCDIEANGEYAVLAEANASIGNGTIQNCFISGQTFVGSNPSFGNQFSIMNVPRQLVVLQAQNLPINFINNTVIGITGGLTVDGVPSYNTAVTADAPNSTITGNSFNGYFGYGYALRCRGANCVVENNTNNIAGSKANSGYLIGVDAGLNFGTNVSVSEALISSSQVSSGDPIKLTMAKEVLKTAASVAVHPTFSDEANWHLVSYVYKKVGSAQRLVSAFKNVAAEKSVKLKAGMQSGDSFQLHKIIISDSNRNLLVLPRAQVDGASGYDFNLK